MLSSPSIPPDDRPGYRPYLVSVRALRRLSPHFTRVTFTGPALCTFGTAGLDQRIKLVLPRDGVLPDIGAGDPQPAAEDMTWYQRWLALPDADRPAIRTYTVRAVRPQESEIDVDFAVHDGADGAPIGAAGAWLSRAAIGDQIVIAGPDALSIHSSTGIDWHPGTANVLLLAGDETAAPAICAIVETLSADVLAFAFLEVRDEADILPLAAPQRCTVTWLPRGRQPHGALLTPAIRAWMDSHADLVAGARSGPPEDLEDVDVDTQTLWDAPDAPVHGGFYAWLAGEAGAIKTLRRFLVTETGIDRARVAFMGYWRLGRTEN